MVEKEIILLTKSTMINHFCTAGIDTKTGEWVRIVSPDTSTQHAVTEADMLSKELKNWPTPNHSDDKTLAIMWKDQG